MDVYVVDGTYELFRHFFAVPPYKNAAGEEVAAVRGVIGSILGMLESGTTHVGVATDQVIESFRNDMWPDYKSSAGVEPKILAQFPIVEEAIEAMGVVLWPMVELEADDALAAAARIAASSGRVDRVYICTPDKDLGQAVVGERVVQLDRRKRAVVDAAGVRAKFGVAPESIPDYLALVGDSSDGYPGIAGWGAKSAATVLARYVHLEAIPEDASQWDVDIRGARLDRLGQTLRDQRDSVYLFRDLATLRADTPLFEDVDALRWRGPTEAFESVCKRLEAPNLLERALLAAKRRS